MRFSDRKAKPGSEAFRVALRDAIEQEREIIGCQGVFNMSPTNHNGMDERALQHYVNQTQKRRHALAR